MSFNDEPPMTTTDFFRLASITNSVTDQNFYEFDFPVTVDTEIVKELEAMGWSFGKCEGISQPSQTMVYYFDWPPITRGNFNVPTK